MSPAAALHGRRSLRFSLFLQRHGVSQRFPVGSRVPAQDHRAVGYHGDILYDPLNGVRFHPVRSDEVQHPDDFQYSICVADGTDGEVMRRLGKICLYNNQGPDGNVTDFLNVQNEMRSTVNPRRRIRSHRTGSEPAEAQMFRAVLRGVIRYPRSTFLSFYRDMQIRFGRADNENDSDDRINIL